MAQSTFPRQCIISQGNGTMSIIQFSMKTNIILGYSLKVSYIDKAT